MLSEKFRRQLRQEVEQWLTEELIDASVYEQLSNRYQFSELETAARNRFIGILLGLGSILLGLGLITFGAANWQTWSRGVKVVLLLSVFIGVNSAGFFLWRRSSDRWQRRLGQGLLLLGALALGANIALLSQLFHHSGPVYQLYLVWGLGVLAMAYSLRLDTLGLFAALLIGLGYGQGQGQPEFVAIGEVQWLRLMVQHMPVLSGLMFIPLAYWCRSRWLFRVGAIAVIAALEINLLRFNLSNSPAWSAAIACALPPAMLWGYRDALWRQRLPATESFDPIARSLAIAFLGSLFYVLSFLRLWDTSSVPSAKDASLLPWPFLVDILILGSLAIWEWLRLLRRVDQTTVVIAMMIAITAVVPYWHLSISRLPAIAVLIFNVFLLILAISLVREGLAQGQRRLFWGGMVLLTLQIFSRMLEYNTGLLFKSIVLLLCGFGIIMAGLWFERHVRKLSARN